MKRTLIALAALGVVAQANAQDYLYGGGALPNQWTDTSASVDNFFVPNPDYSLFDIATGYNTLGTKFSQESTGNASAMGITEANGWFNAALYAIPFVQGDVLTVTYLGKSAGWINDFGINLGGVGPNGAGAYTLWSQITDVSPGFGNQYQITADQTTSLDFWLNSGSSNSLDTDVPEQGGTYSIWNPDLYANPYNTGLPSFDYSARGKLFVVDDNGNSRTILVLGIEDWRNIEPDGPYSDGDFNDMLFAIEIDRDGESQFPVPEPSTYGLIGAMMLLGLVAVRRARRA